jgi:hypothetical protein
MSVRGRIHRKGSGMFLDEDENWEHPSGYHTIGRPTSLFTNKPQSCVHPLQNTKKNSMV